MASTDKDPITCHVLDTTTGRPAINLSVTLFQSSENATATFTSLTNADGRITSWKAGPLGRSSKDIIEVIMDSNPPTTVWTLKFETGDYYGRDKTFWPVVALTFTVKLGEHYHVPLLLGPYSYTTYRGS